MHSTVSQIKICAMLFLSTCHINSPQKNLMAIQPSPHHSYSPTQHTRSSSKSQDLNLNPRLVFSYFNGSRQVPGKAEAAKGSLQHSNSSRQVSRSPLPHKEKPNPFSKHPEMHFSLFGTIPDDAKPCVVGERTRAGKRKEFRQAWMLPSPSLAGKSA